MGSLTSGCCTPSKEEVGKLQVPAAHGERLPSAGPLTFSHAFAQDNPGKVDEHYDISKTKLGQGSFGSVFRARQKSTGADRAVKTVSLKAMEELNMKYPPEISFLRSTDHPNIVKLYETFKDAKCVYIFMELCEGGELLDRIASIGANWTESKAATYFKQLMAAIVYLHRNGIVYRDVKPENLLLKDKEASSSLVVIDFGFAVNFTKGKMLSTKVATPAYLCAPEVHKGSYDNKCDIWSCGVMAYLMLGGDPPFSGKTEAEVINSVNHGIAEFPANSGWDSISQDGKDEVKRMLNLDPQGRPEADAVLNGTWLKRAEVTSKQPLPSIVKKLQNFNETRKLKKVALTLIATQVPESEILELKKNFQALDKNGDGTISKDELTAGLSRLAKAMKVDEKGLEQLMAIDSDGSGEIDYTEFIAACIDKHVYQKRDVVWAAFRSFDMNGDGKIAKAEIKNVIQGGSVGSLPLSEAKLDQLIAEGDKDGDGYIDFEEFMAMMQE